MSKKCYFCPEEEIWISLRRGRVHLCFKCVNDFNAIQAAYDLDAEDLEKVVFLGEEE